MPDRPLRLLIFHWDDYPTAQEVYLREFPRRGHEVTWLLRDIGDGDAFLEERREGVRIVRCQRQRDADTGSRVLNLSLNRVRKTRNYLRRFWWAWKESGRSPYDFIQVRDQLGEALLAWSIARLRGTRFVYQIDYLHFEGMLYRRSLEGRVPWWEQIRRGVQRKVRDDLVRRADVCFFISTYMRELYLSKGVKEDRAEVFPVGVPRGFEEGALLRDASRNRLEAGRAPLLAYIGNLGPMRNVDYICGIMAEVVRARPRVRLLLLGAHATEIEDALERHALQEHVLLADRVAHEEIPGLLGASDVGIFPLRMEDPYDLHRMSSPLKVAEYLAVGIPCVSSPIPEVEEMIQAADGGLLPSDDTKSFAAAIVELVDRPDEAKAMGRRGQDYVLQYKSCPVLAAHVEAAYMRMLSR